MSDFTIKSPQKNSGNGMGAWALKRTPVIIWSAEARLLALFLFIMGLVAVTIITTLILFLSNNQRSSPEQMTASTLSGLHAKTIPVAAQMPISSPLPQVVQTHLLFMREEEKLARDVYMEMHRLWGMSVFKSVAREEQEHMNAVATLLTRYQLPDPISDNTRGVFQNSYLKNLYQTLIQQGQQSVEEALKVCGLQEEINIIDLDIASKATVQADIKEIYAELQRDSFNHLRSFAHGLEMRGISYQGVKLPPQTIDAILHGPMNRGFLLR